ncbi:hypothetical protein [Companilactobacillus sp.]|jgi:hypothetical protein|uniref:hypothetical protein n=1 Tax=Companilactobacillus sp. TaxID=2767905 RepID=UPI0025BA0DCB|nr:hypothetical protein [Companilactobacillus sp.]MCH4009609.1 hypothetical protein [Companilactobacillus sp.]MCH4052715.1 hypothetical protein [Companilactobacillus sp.]MCH4077551.1 hypothetical protein [Companilactobacillus sp.]MCH4126127.1 hypothetical protein [Companilactobacillus sp.]MCI1311835.1 hypothetical protein [Companilactobacillus sp.]
MSNGSVGKEQIKKVLDLFKIEYQTQTTFDDLRSGKFDSLIPVDFSFAINKTTALIEFSDENVQPDQLNAILNFAQKSGYSLLIVDSRDIQNIQATVSKFIDSVRTDSQHATQNYPDYSTGYFFKSKVKKSTEKTTKASNTSVSDETYQKLVRENENYKSELANYRRLFDDFAAQIKELNQKVLDNSQRIVDIQSGELTEKFTGDFRVHGSKTGHLTEPAKRLVLVVTMNLDCNWTEIQRYFKNNYDEDISISTIKRIYKNNQAANE